MLFFTRRLQTVSFLAIWFMTIVAWTPMSMLSHIPAGHASMQHSMHGSQHAVLAQEDIGSVDCGDMHLQLSGCDLACQPMASPTSNKVIKIRSTSSFQLPETKTFIAFSPESIERPPKNSV